MGSAPLARRKEAEARLGEGEGVVAVTSTKTGIAGLLTCFEASEEGLESQINAHRYILKDLRMHATEGGTFLLQDREGVLLLKTGEGDSVPFVGCLAHL